MRTRSASYFRFLIFSFPISHRGSLLIFTHSRNSASCYLEILHPLSRRITRIFFRFCRSGIPSFSPKISSISNCNFSGNVSVSQPCMCHSAACNSTNSTYSSTSGKLFPQHVWFSDLIKIHAISQFPITLGPLEVRLFPFSYSLVVPILISSLGGFTSSRSWFFVYLCPWIYFPSVISNPYYVFRAHVFISASGTLFCPASTLRILFRFITSFVLSKNNFSCLSPVSRTLFSHSPRFPLGYWSISTKSRFRVSFNSIATFHIGNLRANWMLMAEVNYNSS